MTSLAQRVKRRKEAREEERRREQDQATADVFGLDVDSVAKTRRRHEGKVIQGRCTSLEIDGVPINVGDLSMNMGPPQGGMDEVNRRNNKETQQRVEEKWDNVPAPSDPITDIRNLQREMLAHPPQNRALVYPYQQEILGTFVQPIIDDYRKELDRAAGDCERLARVNTQLAKDNVQLREDASRHLSIIDHTQAYNNQLRAEVKALRHQLLPRNGVATVSYDEQWGEGL